MPLPKPKAGEKQKDFMQRCISDPTMNTEFPKEDQRVAICYNQWRDKK